MMTKALTDLWLEYWREWLDMCRIIALDKPFSSIIDIWSLYRVQ
jgi:hypothetical protein